MAGSLSASKNMFVLISGTCVVKSKLLVGVELKKNKDKLLNGLGYFKKPSNASLDRLKNQLKDNVPQLEFILKLSKCLNLDEVQSYELFCCYLLYEYQGSQNNLQGIFANDRLMQALQLEIWNYYLSERLYLLLCMKHMISNWMNDSHPYKELYGDFIESIDENKCLIKKYISQLQDVCSYSVPSGESHDIFVNERHIIRWAISNLKEQIELLQIILLYYKVMQISHEEFDQLFTLFQKMSFGCRQVYLHLLDSSADVLIIAVRHLQILTVISCMELEWLTSCYESGGMPAIADHYLISNTNLFKKIESGICSLIESAACAPILLAWTIVRSLAFREDNSSQPLTYKLGNAALQHKVFIQILTIVNSSLINKDSAIGNLGHTIIYGLIWTLLYCFQESTLGDIEALQIVATKVLRKSNVSKDFWDKVETKQSGFGDLLLSAEKLFPCIFHPLLQMLTALASASRESSKKVMLYMSRLNCYAEKVSASCTSDIHGTDDDLTLVKNKAPYGSNDFIIPKNAVGQMKQIATYGGVMAIQWNVQYNGWSICVLEVEALLQQLNRAAGSVTDDQVWRVTNVAKIIREILHSNSSYGSHFQIILEKFYCVIQRFSILPQLPQDLVAACLGTLAELSTTQPQEVWQNLKRIGILPAMLNRDNDVEASLDGMFGRLLAGVECLVGRYPNLLVFLEILLNVVQFISSNDSHLIASTTFVLCEVFPAFYKWRFLDLSDREKIGERCLKLFHKIFDTAKGELNQSRLTTVQTECIYRLLHGEAGQALLSLVGTGEDTLQQVLEQQPSWLEGGGLELIRLVHLALSVLNRLLLIKPSDKSASPVELTLCCQPANRQRRHIVAVVAFYVYHRYDPRLPTLAVGLLKRFAENFPMSLFACLGKDAEAIRDIFLTRLQAATEDIRLKIAILELLTVCIETQPGLIEIFLNVVSNKETEKDAMVEQASCLQSVLEILQESKQGASYCPESLHTAVVEFIHALWVGRRITAILVLKQSENFWNDLCEPLMSSSIIEKPRICSNIMKLIALEIYNTDYGNIDPKLQPILKLFSDKNHIVKWSEQIHSFVAEDETKSKIPSAETKVFLLNAWRDLLLIIAKKETIISVSAEIQMKLLEDILENLITQIKENGSMNVQIALSELYIILLSIWKGAMEKSRNWFVNLNNLLSLTAANQDSLHPWIQVAVLSAIDIALQILQEKQIDLISDDNLLLDSVLPVCSIIKESTLSVQKSRNIEKHQSKNSFEQVQIVSICVLKDLLLLLKDKVSLWLPLLKQQAILNILLSDMALAFQFGQSRRLIHIILTIFLALATIPQAAESIASSGISTQLCLPLVNMYSKPHDQNINVFQFTGKPKHSTWLDIYILSVKLMAVMVEKLRYSFLPDALTFVGVHQERMLECLQGVYFSLDPELCNEALVTCTLFKHLATYSREWQIQLPNVLGQFIKHIGSLGHACAAYLLRPSYIEHILQIRYHSGTDMKRKDDQHLMIDPLHKPQRQTSLDEVEKPSVQLQEIQFRLMQILSICLASLLEVSSDLCELLIDMNADISQYTPLLQIGFSSPTLDCESPLNFGTIIGCVHACLALLSKIEPSKPPSPIKIHSEQQSNRTLIMFILEQSLLLLVSQAVLYLKNPILSSMEKQLVRRELGTEMASFTVSINKYLRRGGPQSPASSSSLTTSRSISRQSSISNYSTTGQEYPFFKLISKLVDFFQK